MDDKTLAKWLQEWKQWPMPLDETNNALTALLALLRDMAEATEPFIHLQDKGDYALGIITTGQVDRLAEMLARLHAILGDAP